MQRFEIDYTDIVRGTPHQPWKARPKYNPNLCPICYRQLKECLDDGTKSADTAKKGKSWKTK